ncbi:hypothetical protein AX16_007989 [Volvariella volvacea WC 439]|nr:hypothetical protein AX16_007989 [Volvariella volvacea WC 439]
MERRRGVPTRPASTEELGCWSRAAGSLQSLSLKYPSSTTLDTIDRVNRLMNGWPTDDTLPAEGIDGVKAVHKKLVSNLQGIQAAAKEEAKAIDEAIELVGVLIALRKAPESLPPDKRKRPRAASPSGPVGGSAANNRGVSITLPARGSVGPPSSQFPRGPSGRKEAKLPLQEGRKVAFHPPPSKSGTGDTEENTWILAIVTKCIDKNRYQVQDAEPQEDGQPGLVYDTKLSAIIPLPDPDAAPGSISHVNSYPEFPAGSAVLALYPDTSCFYRAEVIATPREMQSTGRAALSSKHIPTYKLKFEDDDNQEHTVPAQWVVEWPVNS